MELIIIILLLIFIIMVFTLKPHPQYQSQYNYHSKPQLQKVSYNKNMDNLVMLPKLNPVPLISHK